MIERSPCSSPSRASFTLIEVLFAVGLLAIVGVALSALSAAALRLVAHTELDAIAYPLTDDGLAAIAYSRKSFGESADFAGLLISGDLKCTTSGCYVDCPIKTLSNPCGLSSTPKPVQIGRNRLQFVRQIKVCVIVTGITDCINNGSYVQGTDYYFIVTATTSWGTGLNRRVNSSVRLE